MLTATFYSFRGGVGRTMAVANVAYQLAKAEQRVFVIDFDLEAPGLSLMPEMQPKSGEEPKSRIGLLGFLEAGIANDPIPDVRDLSYVPAIARDQELGDRLHVMPAGPLGDSEKGYDLSGLDLNRMYADKQRAVVPDDLKAQIEDYYKADYLLIDSRTGLTEIGGICTVHMADVVVVLFGLNEQNVRGTAMVLRKLVKARPELKDNFIFVASPVPMGEEEMKRERIEVAASVYGEALGSAPLDTEAIATIPYHPEVALSERNFVARYPYSLLSDCYGALTGQLRELNPEDLLYKLDRAIELLKISPRDAAQEILGLAEAESAPAMVLAAAAKISEFLDRDRDTAESYFRRAVEADPKNANILGSYAACLEEWGRLEEAEEYYRQALEADPEHADSLGGYAVFLAERGRLEEAEEYYRRAIEADPTRAFNLGNYAVFLQERDRHEEAEECFRQAVEADPGDAGNLLRYALFLKQRERLEEAERYYGRAWAANPKDAEILGSYGWFWYERGDLGRAVELAEKAVALKPKEAWISCNLGLLFLLSDRREEAEGQYASALCLVADEKELEEGAIKDLHEAAAKHPDNKAIPEMIEFVRQAWQREHANKAGGDKGTGDKGGD